MLLVVYPKIPNALLDRVQLSSDAVWLGRCGQEKIYLHYQRMRLVSLRQMALSPFAET